jgi:hypothetical protein
MAKLNIPKDPKKAKLESLKNKPNPTNAELKQLLVMILEKLEE